MVAAVKLSILEGSTKPQKMEVWKMIFLFSKGVIFRFHVNFDGV